MATVESTVVTLVELEQSVLREMLRVAELNTAMVLSHSQFAEAAASVHSSLRRHASLVEELGQLASECDLPADQAEAERHVRRHRTEGATLAQSLRELTAKVSGNRELQEEAARRALLGGCGTAGGDATGGLTARAKAHSARDVTESLRRTRQMMAEELERTDGTLRALDEQGKVLKDTLQEQRGIGGALGTGRRALNRMSRRDFTDRVLLVLGFGFFFVVVLYILKRRLGFLNPLCAAAKAPPPPPLPRPPRSRLRSASTPRRPSPRASQEPALLRFRRRRFGRYAGATLRSSPAAGRRPAPRARGFCGSLGRGRQRGGRGRRSRRRGRCGQRGGARRRRRGDGCCRRGDGRGCVLLGRGGGMRRGGARHRARQAHHAYRAHRDRASRAS